MDPYYLNLRQRSTRVGVGGGTQVQVGEYTRSASDLLTERYTNPALAESNTTRYLLESKERLKKGYKIFQDMYVEEDYFWKNEN